MGIKTLYQIFKKETPVEVIHKEFDDAEEKILDECDRILQELQIPTKEEFNIEFDENSKIKLL